MTTHATSGSNEIQILEFLVGRISYGINALRIKQVIKFEPQSVVPVPGANPCILGSAIFQGQSIPIVDLSLYLGTKPDPEVQLRVVMVCEFNRQINGFLIDSISNMIRIPTNAIQQRSFVAEENHGRLLGIYRKENTQIMLLDFQDITADLFGVHLAPVPPSDAPRPKRRQHGLILAADDSPSARKIISHLLDERGISGYRLFQNGAELLAEFEEISARAAKEGKKPGEVVSLVISDLEMPKMDGFQLCREVKARTADVPVIILSSLVNSRMIGECQAAQADGWIGKDDLSELVALVEKRLAGGEPAAT